MKKEKSYIKYIKGISCLLLFFIIPNIPYLFMSAFGIKIDYGTAMLIDSLFSIVLALVVILIYRKSLLKEFKIFKSDLSENIDIGFKCWFIGLLIMIGTNLIINMFSAEGIASNESAIQEMITVYPWLMLLQAGILAPINEELIFRKTFKDMIKNKWVFILASGFIFGGLHVINSSSLIEFLYIIPYSSLGLAFAYAYYKTNSVFTPMLMHFIHNFILTSISIIGVIL